MTSNTRFWAPVLARVALGFAAGAAGILAFSSTASAQTPAENRAIVEARFQAWSAGTGSPFDLLAEDASWTIEGHSVASRTYPSREAFMSEVIRPFNARMRVGIRPVVRSITADADRVVILFDAVGTARDGRPYVNTYAWFFRMANGRVVEANAFFDALSFNDLWARVSPAE